MKKLLYLFMLSFCMQSLYAQTVKIDRIESDGTHHVMTSSERLKLGKDKYDFSLAYFQKQDTATWCLVVSSYTFISESSEILLKLGNDSIIHLKCDGVNIGSVKEESYGIYLGSGITYNTPETERIFYTSFFEISSNDLDEISSRGINKVRFSTGTDYLDKNIYEDSFGSFIRKGRNKIAGRIRNVSRKGDLYDGF